MSSPARSGAEILAELDPKPRTGVAHICMKPALVDEWQKANSDLIDSQTADAGNGRLAQGGTSTKTRKAAERVRELEEQIEAADVAFTFRKLSKTRHSEICEENPPRDGNQMDLMVGYDRDAVDNAVVLEALIDPVFESCEKKNCPHESCGTWQQLLAFLGPGEWAEMVNVVRELNEAVTTAPKSVLASRILDRPGSASRRRGPSR